MAPRASKAELNWPEGPVSQDQTDPKVQYMRTELADFLFVRHPVLRFNWKIPGRFRLKSSSFFRFRFFLVQLENMRGPVLYGC